MMQLDLNFDEETLQDLREFIPLRRKEKNDIPLTRHEECRMEKLHEYLADRIVDVVCDWFEERGWS